MGSYWLIPGFEDLYLEDSWVLSIDAGPSSLNMLVDLVLRESHRDYRPPSRGGQYCYRKGLIRFGGVLELSWKNEGVPPAVDASGEQDLGSIDKFERTDDRYVMSGNFGTIEVRSEAPVVEFLDGPSAGTAVGGNRHVCPVCGFPELVEPPRSRSGGGSYEICNSCGFEFGVTDDDQGFSYEDWRRRWIGLGMPWDSAEIRRPPIGWDPKQQLAALLRGEGS